MDPISVGEATIPVLGLGTGRLESQECERSVAGALELGYRHIDTAQMYGNERAVGNAIAASSVDRADLFVTTKLDRGNRTAEAVRSTTAESLDRLGLDEVDLLLMHWPNQQVPLEETIAAMNDLQARGWVDHIGVSNFSVEQLRSAVAASETPIVTNQVKYHPFHHQDDLLVYCNEADVILTAYSPLARGRVLEDETIRAIGERHGKTAAQVAIRWLLQQSNVITIPRTSKVSHLRANIDVFDFTLSDEEVEQMFEIDGGLVDRVRPCLL